jgi:hypothetical protein
MGNRQNGLGRLPDRILEREENQLRRRLKLARFPFEKTINQFDFSYQPLKLVAGPPVISMVQSIGAACARPYSHADSTIRRSPTTRASPMLSAIRASSTLTVRPRPPQRVVARELDVNWTASLTSFGSFSAY